MKKIYLIPLLSAGLLLAGCSKENGFESSDDEGQVLKSALDVSMPSDQSQIVVTRAGSDVDLSQFKINFIKTGESVATQSYTYGEMPEVVTLKAAEYRATAELGQDREAEWENPYFKGESKPFEVRPFEITSFIDPIECELLNIKVTIAFDESLAAAMSADSYVEVKVGDNSGLNFTSAEATAAKAGYFRHTNETTLVATFHGTVNGSEIVESKSYNDIAKGRWYKLTFKLHTNHGGDPTGGAEGSVTVDASVTTEDVNMDVVIGEDEPLDDSERPKEDDPDDPTPPTPGDTKAPEITPEGNVVFDEVMNVNASSECKFSISSTAEGGFTVLTCDIISPNLTAEELAGVGLASHIDLVTPGSLESGLVGLGFPVNVGGKDKVDFNLSQFMGLMAVFGPNRHEFKLTVSDANGTTVKSLILQF